MQKDFIKKVLLAVNGSEDSIHAAMYAIMLASSYKIKIEAVYVVDLTTIKSLNRKNILINDEAQEFEQDLEIEGRGCLDYIKGLAGSKGVEIETVLRKGNVCKEIIKEAGSFEADIIIMGGEHKRDGDYLSNRKVSFENRKDILTFSECPVLFVNKPGIQAEFNSF